MAETPRVIYKYPLQLEHTQTLKVPRGAQFLSAQAQGGQLVVWAIVTPKEPAASYRVRIVGTGHALPPDTEAMRYLSTAQAGPLVWHIFISDPDA